jgi:hypothetical protein
VSDALHAGRVRPAVVLPPGLAGAQHLGLATPRLVLVLLVITPAGARTRVWRRCHDRKRSRTGPSAAFSRPDACGQSANACLVHRSGLRRDGRRGPLAGSPYPPPTGGS